MTHPDNWLSHLRDDLDHRRDHYLLRQLEPVEHHGPIIRVDGHDLINLASNDYLGLSQHPHIEETAINAIKEYGTGSASSRLVSGHLTLHQKVEQRFARFKHAEAALILPTGYMANLAAITALAGEGDLICVDKLNHASLLDGARLSGAAVRVFPHLNYDKLQRLLQRDGARQRLIVTDSIFSMDGDAADLPALCELADRYDAILIVDEAHATGVLGKTGAGLCELQGVSAQVDVVISTASKALGSLGGIITAKQQVIDILINRARPFIYTTGAMPAQVAAIDAALDVIYDEPQRRERVLQLAGRVQKDALTPLIAVVTGETQTSLALSNYLRKQGFYAPAIRPPTVAPGSARVRISLRADLEDQHIDRLIDALQAWQVSH